MNRKMPDNQIRHAIDARLSGIVEKPDSVERVLRQKRGEKAMKKRLSVGLVLGIAIVLVTITALAAMMLNTFYQKTIEMEATNGLFSTWTTDDKVSFVHMMSGAGLEVDSTEVAKLLNSATTEEEKDQIASQLVTDCFGSGRGGDLTLYDIIALEYGPYETWSIDIKAQVTEELLKHGTLGSMYAMDVLPIANEISQDQAVQIAYDMLTSRYTITKAELLTMRMDVYFREIPYGVEQTLHRLWQIRFTPFDGVQEYTVDINSDGTVLDSSEPVKNSSNALNNRFFALTVTESFWTPESLAAFAQEWPELIEIAINNGEEVSNLAVSLCKKPYQYPDNTAFPEDEAHQIAELEVLNYAGWSEERLTMYKVSISYRVYTPGKPEWRFGYVLDGFDNYDKFHSGEIPLGIVVRVDAVTGEVLSVKETIEDFAFYNTGEFPDDIDALSHGSVG